MMQFEFTLRIAWRRWWRWNESIRWRYILLAHVDALAKLAAHEKASDLRNRVKTNG